MLSFEQTAVIVPVLNEEARLPWVLDAIQGADPNLIYPEIFVVDNNSTDRSAEIAQAMGARVLRCEQQGKGWAMKRGVQQAKWLGATAATFFDADLVGLTPAHVNKVIQPVVEGDAVMSIGYLGCRKPLAKAVLRHWGGFSGQRTVSISEVWDYLQDSDFKSWRTEGAMNAVCRNKGQGDRIVRTELEGLRHIGTFDKEGNLLKGATRYIGKYSSAVLGLMSLSGDGSH